ncbi:copper amine oxidase N-terminal domain-containing protein [Chengkuizengella sediminis]|uniref:copper amine oxidase N-terminal domain-containing protein n=1 Tax=Chengkuizengella sediminis TaxID=1885917 RepID=UPI001389B536|nr:copper amine oxidase N-terminal domain-containing protein [Chengkuizengella sediminis]NDI34668.1 copper amine oxidase N-terminal domain-containing protein [Chengkuizengella sediminis]
MKLTKWLSLAVISTLITGAGGNYTYANIENLKQIHTMSNKELMKTTLLQNKQYSLEVNGTMLTGNKVPYLNDQNLIMLPLRDVASALGYQVKWDGFKKKVELYEGNDHLELNVGQKNINDSNLLYELFEGTVYVQVDYVIEKLHVNVTISETGTIQIRYAEEVAEQDFVKREGIITNISDHEETTLVEINGYTNGVLLIISEQTKIISKNKQEITVSDLSLGMEIEVEHDLIMTMSYPPMTNAQKITVKEEIPIEQYGGTYGTVVETTTDELNQIIVEGRKIGVNGYDEIKLNITEQTEFINAKDQTEISKDQLKEGAKVYVFYGPKVTKSLPPIGTAEKILVE